MSYKYLYNIAKVISKRSGSIIYVVRSEDQISKILDNKNINNNDLMKSFKHFTESKEQDTLRHKEIMIIHDVHMKHQL